MEIKKNNKFKKNILIVLIIVTLLFTCAVIAYFYQNNLGIRDKNVDNINKTIEKNGIKSKNKSDKKENKPSESSSVNNQNNTREDSKPPLLNDYNQKIQNSPNLTGTVDIYNRPSDKAIVVSAMVTQVINDISAKCVLKLTNSHGQTFIKEAKMVNDPHGSPCYGWSLSYSEIGDYHGSWKAQIEVSGGGRTGVLRGEKEI